MLSNGDVVENGQILLSSAVKQMGKGLTPLNPVLRIWLKTCNGYIPITLFDVDWLLLEQQAWCTREVVSEAKILAGGTKIRMYAGAAPPEELEINYATWLDCIILFIKYIRAEGWITLAERLDSHREIVSSLREKWGWMVALRYCQKIQQGVMNKSQDKEIINIGVLQEGILQDAKDLCKKFSEGSLKSNPYAPGGSRAAFCPLTGQLRPTLKSKTIDKTKTEKEVVDKKPKKEWLPYGQYRAKMEAEARARADERDRERRSCYDNDDRAYDRQPYRERSEERRSRWDDRSRDRRRSHSRSSSPMRRNGAGARRGGARGGRGRAQ